MSESARCGRTFHDPRRNLALAYIQLVFEKPKSAVAAAQCPARQEDHAQQNVDDVIDFAEHQQRADIEHVIGARAQKPTADSQQQINNSEDNAESARAARRSGKTEIQRDGARDDVN